MPTSHEKRRGVRENDAGSGGEEERRKEGKEERGGRRGEEKERQLQGVPKVIIQRFGLIARPVII